ncbi:MAG: Gfo/Idh/MocA family oxidoreductase [Bacteroidota bacterium]
MDRIFKWGIIGPGRIAQKFAAALENVPGAALHAVASRNMDKAKQFAFVHHAPLFYGSYEELVRNPAIDAVYIATPHSFHHAHSLLCLREKKAVLCEKPMSVNHASTTEMVRVARENKVFLMEAMWTRFLPIIDKTIQLINEGTVGTLKYVNADFGFVAPFDAAGRLYNMELGGGSLLDVGIYPLFLVLQLLGKPDAIKAFAQLAPTGADETASALLFYKNGCMAGIQSSIVAQTPIMAEITGTEGTIILDRPWYKGTSIRVRKKDLITADFSLPYGSNGFEFQIQEVQECLEKGATESSRMPLDFSLLMSETMEKICRDCNIMYKLH